MDANNIKSIRSDPRVVSKEHISKEELKSIYNKLEEDNPGIWNILYPRVYTDQPSGLYTSPKTLARHCLNGLKLLEISDRSVMYKTQVVLASVLAKFKFPMYWLTEDLTEALIATKPPVDTLKWEDLELPFEAMAFYLPKRFLPYTSSEGIQDDIAVLSFALINETSVVDLSSLKENYKRVFSTPENEKVLILTAISFENCLYNWQLPQKDFRDGFNLKKLDELSTMMQAYPISTGDPKDMLSKEENSLMGKLFLLLVNILEWINAMPEYVEATRVDNIVTDKKTGKKKQYARMPVIGRNFSYKKIYEKKNGHKEIAIRPHWVRSHKKNQACGPGRKDRKVIKIKRYWANCEPKES